MDGFHQTAFLIEDMKMYKFYNKVLILITCVLITTGGFSQSVDYIFLKDGSVEHGTITNYGTVYVHIHTHDSLRKSIPLTNIGGFLISNREYKVVGERVVHTQDHNSPPDIFLLSSNYRDKIDYHSVFVAKPPGHSRIKAGGVMMFFGGLFMSTVTMLPALSVGNEIDPSGYYILSGLTALSFTIGGSLIINGSIKNKHYTNNLERRVKFLENNR